MVVLVLIAIINMPHLLAAAQKMSNTWPVFLAISIWLSAPATVAAVATATAAHYYLLPLSQSEIRAALFDHLLSGEYSSGASWTERINGDFTSVYSDGEHRLSGTMTFQDDLLCFSYPDATDFAGGCFEVWQRGANCFDFYSTNDSNSLRHRRSGWAWLARAWILGRPATCPGTPVG
jgi:hypothetical protein